MESASIATIALHFRGRRFANLILVHAKASDLDQSTKRFAELMRELPRDFQKPVEALIDFVCDISQEDARRLFTGDCGEKFKELSKLAKWFLRKKHNLSLTDAEAFKIFNILVQNFVIVCHQYPNTMAAMLRANGQPKPRSTGLFAPVSAHWKRVHWPTQSLALLLQYLTEGWRRS